MFFSKNPKFVHFEKFYYFSSILQQICNNLIITEIQRQNSRTFGHYQMSNRVKKTFALTAE